MTAGPDFEFTGEEDGPGFIEDADGNPVGTFTRVQVDRPQSGRPKEDGERVAAYIAYMVAIDFGLEKKPARAWTIDVTRRGGRGSDGEPIASSTSLDSSLRRTLREPETNNLVAGHHRITVLEDGEFGIAHGIDNRRGAAFLLKPGFTQRVREDSRHELVGTGWVWRPGDTSARRGTIKYTAPKDVPIALLNKYSE
jgi:hypothetical protein